MARTELTRQIAYRLYELRRGAPGSPLGDWLLAEELVALCERFFAALEAVEEPAAETAPPPVARPPASRTRRRKPTLTAETALQLLVDTCAALGRREVATKLGYRSASSVGKILRGKRRLNPALVDRIARSLADAG